jgi:glucosamine--fructose-6-phosphate aminotransferase (isomerizing)
MPPCGIIAYCGTQYNMVDTLIDGLERLEYRGYDSAGVGMVEEGKKDLTRVRAVGRVANLKTQSAGLRETKALAGIAHTRWATHGAPSVANSHPHANASNTVMVVHNGIVENYESLRTQLQSRGFKFTSETDTEVMAHLLDDILNTFPEISLGEAVRLAISQVEGTFGFVVVSTKFPNTLVGARRGSPMIIGVDKVGEWVGGWVVCVAGRAEDMSGESWVVKVGRRWLERRTDAAAVCA